jgi:hypothetical protein
MDSEGGGAQLWVAEMKRAELGAELGWWAAARELTCGGPRRCARKLAGMGMVGRIWGCLTWAMALRLETVGMGRVSAP